MSTYIHKTKENKPIPNIPWMPIPDNIGSIHPNKILLLNNRFVYCGYFFETKKDKHYFYVDGYSTPRVCTHYFPINILESQEFRNFLAGHQHLLQESLQTGLILPTPQAQPIQQSRSEKTEKPKPQIDYATCKTKDLPGATQDENGNWWAPQDEALKMIEAQREARKERLRNKLRKQGIDPSNPNNIPRTLEYKPILPDPWAYPDATEDFDPTYGGEYPSKEEILKENTKEKRIEAALKKNPYLLEELGLSSKEELLENAEEHGFRDMLPEEVKHPAAYLFNPNIVQTWNHDDERIAEDLWDETLGRYLTLDEYREVSKTGMEEPTPNNNSDGLDEYNDY